MKKNPFAACAAALLSLSLALSATACFKTPEPPSEDSETAEPVTLPPLTVPDPTDDREFTDTSPYAERLEALFAESAPAEEEDLVYEITEAGEATVTGYTGSELVLVIPDTLGGKPVTAIGEKAFAGMATLKAVSVPDTVTSVGFGAFAGCTSMTSLRTPVFTCADKPWFGALFGATSYEANGGAVPAELSTLVLTAGDSIPAYAFYACRGLEAVSLPRTLTELGDFAFYGCEALVYVTTEATALTSLGERALAGCASLLEMILPATVERMGMGMLEGCAALECLTLPFVGGGIASSETEAPTDTAYLGYLFGAADYTFTAGYLPASLITVTLLEGCGDIPANAFFECATVREILLPEGITRIGRRAFYGCAYLADVTLPDSVTAIGDDAFHGCSRLRGFTGGAGLSELGVQCFMNCVSLVTVTLPDSVTHLPNSCFSGCLSLETLTAEGVLTQGSRVFHRCDKLTNWSNSPAQS